MGARQAASPASDLAVKFVTAWTRSDYLSMYSEIDRPSQQGTSIAQFASAYEQALRTATATHMSVAGRARSVSGTGVMVPVRVQTRLFGALSLDFSVKIAEGREGVRVAWSRSLSFPGLRAGELLARSTTLPRRASILAREGSVLAESPPGTTVGQSGEATRSSPLGEVANAVLGNVGPVPSSRREALEAQGVPSAATVGVSGVELALDERLRGTPGGELLAVQGGQSTGTGQSGQSSRVLAYASPRAAQAVHSTVSPAIQRAAVLALGGQLGGIVAMQPSTGQILAVAGIGLDGLQPPGSTLR